MRPALEWDPQRQNRLTVGDTHFNVTEFSSARNDTRIVIEKNRTMLEALATVVADTAPRHMVELGIARGGSTAFLAQIAQPEKLVAIEKDPTPVPALDEYIATHDLRGAVRPYYGVDQGDRTRLEEILDAEFAGKALDFVSDDASHVLGPTRASFNMLFPRLRPGGVYMIEDWIWAHYSPAGPRDFGSFDEESPAWIELLTSGTPLTVLIFELVMTCASTSGIIEELKIDPYFVQVRRGGALLDAATFDISHSYVEGPMRLLAPEVTGGR